VDDKKRLDDFEKAMCSLACKLIACVFFCLVLAGSCRNDMQSKRLAALERRVAELERR